MRIGIFGGSFDPVHVGHMVLAEACSDGADLDQVWFVPTAQQPLKPNGAQASEEHRLAMLESLCVLMNAVHHGNKFGVSTIEIDRAGVSYTIDTLEAVQARRPDDEIFFLMGADSLADLPAWHRPADICRLATPIVVHREGTAKPDFQALGSLVSSERLEEIRRCRIDVSPPSVSSSEIRRLIAIGGDWQKLVTPGIAEYIEQHQLYRN